MVSAAVAVRPERNSGSGDLDMREAGKRSKRTGSKLMTRPEGNGQLREPNVDRCPASRMAELRYRTPP